MPPHFVMKIAPAFNFTPKCHFQSGGIRIIIVIWVRR